MDEVRVIQITINVKIRNLGDGHDSAENLKAAPGKAAINISAPLCASFRLNLKNTKFNSSERSEEH
jgi:hypothetical protein